MPVVKCGVLTFGLSLSTVSRTLTLMGVSMAVPGRDVSRPRAETADLRRQIKGRSAHRKPLAGMCQYDAATRGSTESLGTSISLCGVPIPDREQSARSLDRQVERRASCQMLRVYVSLRKIQSKQSLFLFSPEPGTSSPRYYTAG